MRRTLVCGPFVLAVVTLSVALTIPVRLCKAVPILYWDGTGTSWSTDSSWSLNSNATTPDPTGTIDNIWARFNITTVNTAQTVNLNGAQSAYGLIFNSAGPVVIQSGSGTNTLTVGVEGIIVNAGAGADAISSAVTLGTNGATGESWTNNSSNLLTVSGTVSNLQGLNFQVGGTGNTTLSGSVNTANTVLTKIGSGMLTLSGATDNNSLPVTVTGGTVVLAKTSSGSPNEVHAIGQDALTISGGTAQLGGTGGDQIYNLGTVIVTSGVFDTNARNETFATLTLQGTGIGGAGALVNTAAGASTITPTNGTTLTADTTIGVTHSGASLTLNNAVSGNFALTKVGDGALRLSGNNTFSGGVNLDDGILLVGSNSAIGSGPLILMGGTIEADGAARVLSNALDIRSDFAIDGSNDLTLSSPTVTTLQASRIITVTGTGIATLSGRITSVGSAGLIKSGAGTLRLSGVNNVFVTGVTVNDGTLLVASNSALGSALTIDGGAVDLGTFSLGGAQLNLISGSLSLTNNLTFGTTGLLGSTLTVASNQTVNVSGATTIDSTGKLTLSGGSFNTTALAINGEFDFLGGTLGITGPAGFTIGSGSPLGTTVSLGAPANLHVTNTLHINSAGRLTNVSGNVLAGNVQLDAGGRWTVTDGVQSVGTGLVNQGTLVLIDTTINGPVNSPAGSVVNVIGGVTFNQLVSGAGQFFGSGTTTFNGGYHPGDSPATVNFQGGVALGGGNTLAIELGGLAPGAQYDQVHVAGQLLLGGTLAVSFINGFNPGSTYSFDILDWGTLSGTFSTIVLPSLAGGLTWNTSQLYTAGILSIDSVGLPGDYNHNGVVDAADYVVWRKGLGTTYTQNDYNVWRANFGQTAGSGSGSVAIATVPEPTTLILTTFAMAAWIFRGSRTPKMSYHRINA